MFNVNDYVVYQYWVCQVVDITKMDNFSKDTLFYIIKSLYEKETFYIPIDNNKSIRKPLDKNTAIQLIDDMPNIQPLENPNDELYRNTIHNYDCISYIKILKSVYNKNRWVNSIGKKLSIIDNKYSYLAEKYLIDELSFALDIPKENVDTFIKDRIEKANIH